MERDKIVNDVNKLTVNEDSRFDLFLLLVKLVMVKHDNRGI